MAKNIYTINHQVETASSALAVLRTMMANELHADDRKNYESLIGKAEDALDRTSNVLADLRRKLEDVADSL